MSAIFQSLSRTLLLRPTITTFTEVAGGASYTPYFWYTSLRFKQGVKANSGVKKRIRLRGSGSLKRMKSGRSHNTGYKNRQRVNRLGSSTQIEEKKIEKRIRKMMGCS